MVNVDKIHEALLKRVMIIVGAKEMPEDKAMTLLNLIFTIRRNRNKSIVVGMLHVYITAVQVFRNERFISEETFRKLMFTEEELNEMLR
ncbi:MAG: hypothetical protein RQ885_07105 [Desulfurococcales archaeon]|jgi:hypothetical protein|nr:hypothetical protein [Desulfurococcales archaeon]